jgi:hypothetical protein
MLTLKQGMEVFPGIGISQIDRRPTFQTDATAEDDDDDAVGPDEGEAPLDDAARGEREYVRQRLREELKREPTEIELDEWLRQHTEGY